jgi:hypothetical protein
VVGDGVVPVGERVGDEVGGGVEFKVGGAVGLSVSTAAAGHTIAIGRANPV